MRRGTTWTVTQRLRGLVMLLVALMLVALLTGTVAVLGAYQEVDRLANVNGPAADANASLLQTLTDAETGLRGYQQTQNPTLLEPFDGAEQRAEVQQQDLQRALHRDLPQWSGRLSGQERAIAAWWAYANESSSGGVLGPGGADRNLLSGKVLFDRVRSANAEIGHELKAQRVATREASTSKLRTALLLLVGGALLAAMIALYAGWRISRSLTGAIDALHDVVRAQRHGDGVVRADVTRGPLDVRDLAADFNHLTEGKRQLEADHEEAIRMGEVTLGLATQLRGQVGAQDALEITVRTLAEATSTTVAIFTTDKSAGTESGSWRLAASWPPEVLDESRVVLVPPVSQASITQRLWLSGRLLESTDLAHDELRDRPFIRSIANQVPMGALLGTPLGVGNDIIGAILLIAPEPRQWTAHERTALQQTTAYTARAFFAEERVVQQAEHVERLEALDRQKDEFVGTVSHELRTPLTSIAGYLEMLVDGDLGELSAAQLKALTVIERNAVRLRGLIEDVLVLNRIETRGLDPSFVPVDIRDLVQEVAQDLQPQAAAQDVALVVTPVPTGSIVDGDSLQLSRALTNVMGNAVKFSRAGGTVTVEVMLEATRVRVTCRDEGIGIPKADMQQMFSRFFRASNATAQSIPGTGLGLAIVRAIIDAHHGELELHSVEGEGTTVVLVLPLTTHPSQHGEPAIALWAPLA